MVFASGIFVFVFLPITLAGYHLLKNKPVVYKNAWLLIMSGLFYLKSGVAEFILLVLSVVVNYLVALRISRLHNKKRWKRKQGVLVLGIIYNVGALFVFKYLSFVLKEISFLLETDSIDRLGSIALPLGISFYTFQALSYLVDVYRDNDKVEKKLTNVALYISFFPQLVAGPIVRWDAIHEDMVSESRQCYWNEGLELFAIGLAKKVLIANQMALCADKAFALLEEGNLTVLFAWAGAIAYTLQIYYDFSGYSDMAIGLGKIFGFQFPINFDYPYISKSVTEFWRRWHISLSKWFRDYVYIPMGGNRGPAARVIFNLFVVWMCTGVWHGANYTFWLWGLLYFIVLVSEKMIFKKNQNIHTSVTTILGAFKHIYTMLVVVLLWVIFRASSVMQAFEYITCMFVETKCRDYAYAIGVTQLYLKNYAIYGIIAVIGCMPVYRMINVRLKNRLSQNRFELLKQVYILLIFILACCKTIDSNYNPFIYFNF